MNLDRVLELKKELNELKSFYNSVNNSHTVYVQFSGDFFTARDRATLEQEYDRAHELKTFCKRYFMDAIRKKIAEKREDLHRHLNKKWFEFWK